VKKKPAKKTESKKTARKSTAPRVAVKEAKASKVDKVGAEAGDRLKHHQWLIAQCDTIPEDERKTMMLALTVTCAECHVDVGEFCVVRGKARAIAKDMACDIRVEQSLKAKALIDRELAKRGQTPSAVTRLEPGVAVFVRWPPNPPKLGILVKYTASGQPLIRVARVDAKGLLTGEMGTPRTFELGDLMFARPVEIDHIEAVKPANVNVDVGATATAVEKSRRKVEKQGVKALATATGNAPTGPRGSPLDRAVATAERAQSTVEVAVDDMPWDDDTGDTRPADVARVLLDRIADVEEQVRVASLAVSAITDKMDQLQYGPNPGVVGDELRGELAAAVAKLSRLRMHVHELKKEAGIPPEPAATFVPVAEPVDENLPDPEVDENLPDPEPVVEAAPKAKAKRKRKGSIGLVTEEVRPQYAAEGEPPFVPSTQCAVAPRSQPSRDQPASQVRETSGAEPKDVTSEQRRPDLSMYANPVHEGGETYRQRDIREARENRFKPVPPVAAHHPDRIDDEKERREDALAKARQQLGHGACIVLGCPEVFVDKWATRALMNPPDGWYVHEEDGGDKRHFYCPAHFTDGERATEVYEKFIGLRDLPMESENDSDRLLPADGDDATDEDGRMPWE
jgi:hypothetical protein